MFRIVGEALALDALVLHVSGAEVGGVATFVGIVRVENAGKRVVAVEYHAYPAMAEKVMREIGEELERLFGSLRIAMVHRTGRLSVGEASVVIAVGAAHRREALAAVSHAIERLKHDVPIWKKEFYEDGSEWLEPASVVPRAGINK
ncbi:MAG: molybdenum cofactor biosynthesis protein MoaE [Acidobacteria bacterium]|nr:molybdenum cofactor biosynthesis protein MoaE [Acidobacteriota bacterium]MCI0567507.1 molybdenum cofactor biosynthesis protein MoaE [Acidobacteriota bacterium]